MPLSRRYTPELAPGEVCVCGMDFSYVIPLGVGIASGALQITGRTANTSGYVTAGPVTILGRVLYATITASPSADSYDYKLMWTATDTQGNIWPRTALLLCAATS